jgi:uncharacterized protein
MECTVDSRQLTAPETLGEGESCRLDEGALVHVHDDARPSALACLVHDSFRALVLNPHFACLGGQGAVRQNSYGFGLYPVLGSLASTRALARGLQSFNDDEQLRTRQLTAFAACFVAPSTGGEKRFERRLWATLQQLSDLDTQPWAADRRTDPRDSEFSFSFGGVAFFVIGLHAGSSRLARRFAWPTLIFNPHVQFDRLRSEGKYAHFRDVIRTRDTALQGTINPMLSDFGEESEARQYSGRAVGSAWECPFNPRRHGGTPPSGSDGS